MGEALPFCEYHRRRPTWRGGTPLWAVDDSVWWMAPIDAALLAAYPWFRNYTGEIARVGLRGPRPPAAIYEDDPAHRIIAGALILENYDVSPAQIQAIIPQVGSPLFAAVRAGTLAALLYADANPYPLAFRLARSLASAN